jgi:hypothetical protein
MKEVIVDKTPIGPFTLSNAMHVVFGLPTLTMAHGPSLKLSSWQRDEASGTARRTVRYTMDVSAVPPPVRRFFCGKQLRITSRQTLTETPCEAVVSNKVRMHFLGAELFHVKPKFVVSVENGTAYLSGRVEHHAFLPPPLSHVVEDFMALHSRLELKKYAQALSTMARPCVHRRHTCLCASQCAAWLATLQ